jgi:hypothetical protein
VESQQIAEAFCSQHFADTSPTKADEIPGECPHHLNQAEK